jgi:hypothetical protein
MSFCKYNRRNFVKDFTLIFIQSFSFTRMWLPDFGSYSSDSIKSVKKLPHEHLFRACGSSLKIYIMHMILLSLI